MGLFDDLIPQAAEPAQPPPDGAATAGLFDDLISVRHPQAPRMDARAFAAPAMAAANPERPRPAPGPQPMPWQASAILGDAQQALRPPAEAQPLRMSLADIRRNTEHLPEFAGLSDADLLGRVHQRYFGHMPRSTFDRVVDAPIGIDFSRSIPEVRADIAKLPDEDRPRALRQWADAYVARERGELRGDEPRPTFMRPLSGRAAYGDISGAQSMIRNVGRGTLVGPFLDEIEAGTQAALHGVSGGRLGAPYDEAVAYQRAQDRAADTEAPVASALQQIAGGLASGTQWVRAAQTLPRQMARGAGVVGPLHAYLYGAGNAEGDLAERNQAGIEMVPMGAMFGGALPIVARGAGSVLNAAHSVLSPTLARAGGYLGALPRRIGISASADGAGPDITPGAQAAGQQVIANQLLRAGRSADDLQEVINAAEHARRFNSNSYAQNALAPVDLDPSLQRLASTIGRQAPEAANDMQAFLYARQTGLTPSGRPLPFEAGLPTRPMMAQPQAGDLPMGQRERTLDALKRALLIKDTDYHGHAANAYRTEQQIIEAAKAEAQTLYNNTYQAGRNVDLRPHITPILNNWAAAAANEPEPVARAINGALRLFQTKAGPVQNIQRFDKAKQFLDGQIEKLFTSVEGRNRYLGGVLTSLKNEMLGAVDGITERNLGARYSIARDRFSSAMEARESLRLGQRVFRDDSDVGVDAFQSLNGKGNQKLARLGVLWSAEQASGRQKRGADITQMFDNPRIQEILRNIIPRTQTATGRAKVVNGAPAAFSDRPQRFGAFVGAEQRMVGTRNEVMGNSKTAQRLADDKAFDTLSSVVDHFRSSPSLVNVGIKALERGLDKMFGFRADTATSIARQLFTADPVQRAQVLNNVKRRMGRNRFEQFQHYLRDYQSSLVGTGARNVPQPQSSGQ